MSNKVVSPDELEVLLAPPDGAVRSPAYDFRRPDRVTAEQLRSLQLLHDRFAQDVATSLSAFLRTTLELRLTQMDQLAYSEFLGALPDSTALYALAMQPLKTFATLEVSPEIAFTMIDRMLGGTGSNQRPERPLTEIEQNVLDSVIKPVIDQLTHIWRNVAGAQFTVHARDTRPQMLQVTGPNEIVVLLTFAVKVGEMHGTLKLCIPAAVFEAVGDKFAHAWHQTPPLRTPEQSAWLHANLGRVPMAVSVQLTTLLAARELLALSPGDVLTLGHHAREPVAVSVGDIEVFVGHLVVHKGSLAVRVHNETGSDASPHSEGTLS
jgi:flagellar motor switch protein FliM